MISKDNIKYYILLHLFYNTVQSYRLSRQMLDGINGLMSFFSPFLIGIFLTLLLNPMIMFSRKKI